MTKIKIGSTYCMGVTIEWAREMSKYNQEHGRSQVLFQYPKGNPKSYEETFKYLDGLEAQGFEYVPQCKYVDKRGVCKGHPIKETAKEKVNNKLKEAGLPIQFS